MTAQAGAGPQSAREARRHNDDPARRLNVGASDQRERFQIDRDRVLYCSAFRRLGGVTQVVGSGEGQLFHNRLTHSSKAAQIGRRLAQRILQDHPHLANAVDPEIVEAAALAHDLGHPPFGHVGETELDRLVRAAPRGATDGYEGNAQTFRILTRLACHRIYYDGLDLTRAALRAVIKYPWLSDDARATEKKKWNAYLSEREDFDFAMDGGTGQSLEAQLMELSDDIAYSVHDMEDFYRAGWIPLDRVANSLAEQTRFLDGIDWTKQSITRNQAHGALGFILTLHPQAWAPYEGRRVTRAELRTLTSKLIARYVREASIEGDPPQVKLAADPQAEIIVLKKLAAFYVFSNPALVAQQHGHQRLIASLFNAFWAAAHHEKHPAPPRTILPAALLDFLEQQEGTCANDDERDQLRTRVAADAVASLTEQEAIALDRRLTGYDKHSVRDRLVY